MRNDSTRDKLKRGARALFSERGIDNVTTREIVRAAGQKNAGSLHYYFRTKEALVRELVRDGARALDAERARRLERVLGRSPEPTARELIEVIVLPAICFSDTAEGLGYIRFATLLQMNHRALLREALGNENRTYDHCMALLAKRLCGVPEGLLKQRLAFVGQFISASLSAREAAMASGDRAAQFWAREHTTDNLIDSIENMLTGPASLSTQRRYGALASAPAASQPRGSLAATSAPQGMER